MHWREQRKLTKLWSNEVMVAKCEQLDFVPDPAVGWRSVLIVSFRKGLIRDKDNLYGGCKPVLDALVDNKLIQDDRRELCQLSVFQQQHSEDPFTRICIKQ